MNEPAFIFPLHEQESKGGLPYMITWTSQDGRPRTEYHGEFEEAWKQLQFLRVNLKLRASLWHRIIDVRN